MSELGHSGRGIRAGSLGRILLLFQPLMCGRTTVRHIPHTVFADIEDLPRWWREFPRMNVRFFPTTAIAWNHGFCLCLLLSSPWVENTLNVGKLEALPYEARKRSQKSRRGNDETVFTVGNSARLPSRRASDRSRSR